MNILMLTQFYPPVIGGVERHVRNLSTKLVALGHQVAVATIWHRGLPESEVDQGVRIYRIRSTVQRARFLFTDTGHFFAPSFPDPELAWALRRIVKAERPEIVHGHNWMVHSFLPLKPWSNAKLVLSVHDHSLICPNGKLIYRDALCTGPGLTKCLSCAGRNYGSAKGAAVLASHYIMGFLERAAVDMFVPVNRYYGEANWLMDGELPVRVISNFLPDDMDLFPGGEHPRMASQLPQGDFMLFVGALARYKGLDTLLQAYAAMKDAPPLVVIGYRTQRHQSNITDLPPRVTVFEDWPHDLVMDAWRRCLFGLVPSLYSDPIPTVALEGMAMGKALIASKIGGLPDLVVDGENGLVVAPGDPVELQHAMERLAADPDLRKRMGEAARRKVVDFQASAVVPRIEALYRELCCRFGASTMTGKLPDAPL